MESFNVETLIETVEQLRDSVDFLLSGKYNVQYRAPDRPREGMLLYADGTQWDPSGYGAGFVIYTAGAWKRLAILEPPVAWTVVAVGSLNGAAITTTTISASFRRFEDLVMFSADFTVDNINTATGHVRVTTPVAVAEDSAIFGWRVDTGYYGLAGSVYGGGVNAMDITKASDGSAILVNGSRFRISGRYRA